MNENAAIRIYQAIRAKMPFAGEVFDTAVKGFFRCHGITSPGP